MQLIKSPRSKHVPGDGAANLYHFARETVAKRDGRIEFRVDLFDSRPETVALHVADDLAHEVWTRQRFTCERSLSEVHKLLFGASRDQ